MITEYICAFAFALVSQNISEWLAHKYILHKMGAKKTSFFHYHWEHHRRCRKNKDNIDKEYKELFENLKFSNMIKKEILLILLSHLFIAIPTYVFFWPALGIAYFCAAWYYYLSHALSHATTKFAFLMPWHEDHHLNLNQNMNWCVTFPWFDWLMTTRVKRNRSRSKAT